MILTRGSTSVRRLIFIADATSSSGAGLTGLTHASSGLTWYYFAGDLSNEVAVTPVTATLGSYTSGGFIEVDGTNMPGWYEIGIPNAALDGGNEVAIQLRGVTNMVPVNIHIQLQDNPADFILTRNVSNVETTMPEHCLGTVILAMLEWTISGTDLYIKGTDGTTTRFTKVLTTSPSADKITGVN